MKTFFSVLSATILLGTAIPAAKAVEVSVDFFHEHLEEHGDWREVGDYGYCWQPRGVDEDWQPYSEGRWLYTDAGWTWDSDEPYSWAVYHYGRWARVDRVGWVWVPGTEWGPAWVSWRRSERHVGWAPLPPEARFSRTDGFHARVDVDFDIGPSNYRFVTVGDFGAPRLRKVMIQPRENITIIQQTRNITNITYVNNVVYNQGPRYEVISRESTLPIRRLRLERRENFEGDDRARRPEQLRARVEGDSFRVLALPFDSKPATAPRKVAAKVEKVEVDRGWKNAGPPEAVARVRTKIKEEPARAVEAAPQPPQPGRPGVAEKPAEAPVPVPAPGDQPPKGKVGEEGKPPRPGAPGRPPQPVPPVADEKPEKPMKPENPRVRPERPAPEKAEPATPPTPGKVAPPAPPAPEKAEPATPPLPRGKKERKVPPPKAAPEPGATAPERTAPDRKPEGRPNRRPVPEKAEPKPETDKPAPPVKRPDAEKPAERSERPTPKRPAPRPEAKAPEPREKAPVAEPAAPRPAKERGKGKPTEEKDEKKKPEQLREV